MLGTNIKEFVVAAETWHPGFLHPCCKTAINHEVRKTLLAVKFCENIYISVLVYEFVYCLSTVRERITFNSNKSPTICNNFPVYYPDVYLQLNMFQAFPRPSSGAQ
jgi:hypothetical protein